VRYFHNQIRPRSGPSNKTEREAAHAKTLCIYAIKRDSATEPAEIQKKETREKRKRKAALLRDSNVFSFIPSEQRAPLFNNDIFDKNYTMYISSGAKIFNAIYIDIASAEKFPVPSGMLNDFPEVYTTCKPNPAAAIFFLSIGQNASLESLGRRRDDDDTSAYAITHEKTTETAVVEAETMLNGTAVDTVVEKLEEMRREIQSDRAKAAMVEMREDVKVARDIITEQATLRNELRHLTDTHANVAKTVNDLRDMLFRCEKSPFKIDGRKKNAQKGN